MAKQLLLVREKGYNPWRVGVFSRRQNLRYLIIVLMIFLKANSEFEPILDTALLGAIGVIIGAFVNEIVFIFRISNGWPFTQKITDWNLVEQIANGEERP